MRGLKTLQDQVPPFDTNEARRMIQEELGVPVENIFSEFRYVLERISLAFGYNYQQSFSFEPCCLLPNS